MEVFQLWLSFSGVFLSFVILGLQALLLKKQKAIGVKIAQLEERVTELELEINREEM